LSIATIATVEIIPKARIAKGEASPNAAPTAIVTALPRKKEMVDAIPVEVISLPALSGLFATFIPADTKNPSPKLNFAKGLFILSLPINSLIKDLGLSACLWIFTKYSWADSLTPAMKAIIAVIELDRLSGMIFSLFGLDTIFYTPCFDTFEHACSNINVAQLIDSYLQAGLFIRCNAGGLK
jgi:hypothetical protein